MKQDSKEPYKVGKVAIVGRPNVGKSTILNALVHQKVAIVSPKPQTTRSQIVAYVEDNRGQIFFLDTPGFYVAPAGTAHYNALIADSIREADVLVYVVDHTRDWGQEEERMWNMVEDSEKPVIVAINKIDVVRPSFKDNYLALLEKRVDTVVELSALREQHLKTLTNHLFRLLPAGERDRTVDFFPTPLLSQSSKEYLAEIVREKIYHLTGQEIPYQTAVRVSSVEEDEVKNTLRIEGEILVAKERYKGMLIGKQGRKIEEIKNAVRKELKIATDKDVHLRLRVVTRRE